MFKIEKGIPLAARSHGREKIYPFSDMEIGDSFLTENKKVGRAAIQFTKRHNNGWKFATRKEGDGVRVWRIA